MFNKMPVFNIFGIDPFDYGESNIANGFCQLSNFVNQVLNEAQKPSKYRSEQPNVRAVRDEKLDTFYVELPGVKKEDIDIMVSGAYTLKIEAKRKIGNTETTFRTELTSNKDIENAKVSYADGLLTMTVEPKKKVEPEIKKLQIQ